MAKGNKDLDRALDETIKLNSSKGRGGKKLPALASSKRPVDRANSSGGRQQLHSNGGGGGGNHHPRGNYTTMHSRAPPPPPPTRGHVNHRIGNKPVHQRVGGGSDTLINSRLGRGINKPPPHRGAGVVGSRAVSAGVRNGSLIINRSNRAPSERLDPSKIIITKPVISRTASVKKTDRGSESLVIQSKISKPHVAAAAAVAAPDTRSKPKQHSTHTHSASRKQRTRSPPPPPQQVVTTTAPIPEPEKKIVLVCNLDPRATAEDVGEACSMFGPILSCDMLLDPMGRPLNEAEIEFMYADSAKECVTKLDNTLADGRLLRAKLQDAPTQSVKPRYSSRSVVASARLQPGAFDNQSPMLQQQQQPQHHQPIQHHPYPQQNYPPVYSSQPYYPQQPPPPPPPQHYRRY